MHQANKLEQKLIDFTVSVVQFTQKLTKTPEPIIKQIIRSASSVGANYTEAINGSSKADFKNKIFIAKKEASETRYWLQVIQKIEPLESIEELKELAQKYIMTFQKTINTLNNAKDKG